MEQSKRISRKAISALLSLLMLLSCFSGLSLTAWADTNEVTITFKSSGSSSDGSSARDSVDMIIDSGASYVSSLSASKVYNGKDGCGIKLGSSSQAGSLTLNLSSPMTVSAITVEAKKYSASDSCGLTIQDKTYDGVSSDFGTFTYTYAQPTEISSVALSSTGKRIYIKSVTLIGQAASAEDATWSANQSITENTDIGKLTVNTDITVTIAEGKTVTVHFGIDASDHTLTVAGAGTLVVKGKEGNKGNDNGDDEDPNPAESGTSGESGVTGNLVVNGATVQITGGNGGDGGNAFYFGGSGGSGGNGVQGNVTVIGGAITITGGNGGTGGQAYAGNGSNGTAGRAVTGTISGDAEESAEGDNWIAVSADTSTARYVKVTAPATDNTVTIYFKVEQSWWNNDGAVAAGVYYWSDSSSPVDWPGVRMEKAQNEENVWTCEIPAGYNNLIFTRVTASGDIMDMGVKTADLTLPTDGKNMYTVTSTSAVYGDPGVTGEWGVYSAEASAEDGPLVGTVIKVGDTLTLDGDYIECMPGVIDQATDSFKLERMKYDDYFNGWGAVFEETGAFLIAGDETPEPDGFYVSGGNGTQSHPYTLALHYASAEPAPSAYADYLPAEADDATALAAKVVKFNGYDWYLIEDNSTSETEGTVTLFAKDTIGSSRFDNSKSVYSGSMVKSYLDKLTAEGGAFADVADAIVSTDLEDVTVTGAKLWLLSKDEVITTYKLSTALNKCSNDWWLRTPADSSYVIFVNGTSGSVNNVGNSCMNTYGVRPALKLDLSKVEFNSETKTFALPAPSAYAGYVPAEADDATALAAKVVKFNGYDWYLIEDNSTSETEGTVTLLAKECVGASAFGDNNTYSGSTLESYVNSYYADNFSAAAQAAVSEGLFILTKEQAQTIHDTNVDVLKCSQADGAASNKWWLSSSGSNKFYAAYVYGDDGVISSSGPLLTLFGVRPALQLDLSKVEFNSETKTFALPAAAVTEYPLWVGGVMVTSENMSGEGWNYAADTNTLTLNGYTNSGTARADIQSGVNNAAIYYNDNMFSPNPLTIQLAEGTTNSLTMTGDRVYGIYVFGSALTITGNGTLNVQSDDMAINDAWGVAITGGTVNAASSSYYGIGSVTIGADISSVTITGKLGAIYGGSNEEQELINAIAGTGWTDTAGTTGKAYIAISTTGQNVSSYKKVYFTPHTHDFSYSTGYNAIIAECTADGCTLDDGTEQHNHIITLNIVAPTLTTYGQTGEGISAEATLDGLDAFNAATGLNVSATDIKYYEPEEFFPGYTRPGEELEGAPTDAGTYFAGITLSNVKISETDTSNVSAYVSYTIAKADPTYTAPTGLTATYGDTLSSVTLPTGWSWANGSQKVGNAGTRTFKANFTPADTTNYNTVNNIDVTVTVAKANQTAPAAPTEASKTINSITLNEIPNGEYKCGTGDWQTSPTFTGLEQNKTYTFRQRYAADENHNASAGSEEAVIRTANHAHSFTYSASNGTITATCNGAGTCDLTENKVSFTLTAPTNLVYDGTDKKATLEGVDAFNAATGLNISANDIVYNYKATSSDSAVVVTETKNAGIYQALYTLQTDFPRPVAGITFTVAKANPTYTVPTGLTATYGQTLKDVTLPTGWAWVDDTTSVGDAGTKTFKANFTPADTTNYNVVENVDVTVKVNPADITPTVTLDGWTYGQEANAPSVSGNTGNGAVTYTYAQKGSDEFSSDVPTDAGDYTVKAVIAETANYNGGEATADFTIAKADIAPTVSIEGWTYGQEANAPSVSGNTGNGAVTYTYATKGSDSFSATVPTNAGNYTVKATVTATTNYNGGTATAEFTIAKADSVPATVTANKLTCDGTGKALVTVTGEVAGGEMQYALGKDAQTAPEDGWNTDVPAATNTGTYFVWYKVVADENHNDLTPVCVEVTIDPNYTVKEVTGLSGNGKDEWTKGGEDGVVITVKDSGEDNSFDHFIGVKLDGQLLTKDVDYTVTKSSTIVTLLPATLEKLSVGEHTVTVLFDNGEVGTDLTVKAANSGNPTSPQTGDNSHMGLWIALMILSLCGFAAALFIGKKKRVFDR